MCVEEDGCVGVPPSLCVCVYVCVCVCVCLCVCACVCLCVCMCVCAKKKGWGDIQFGKAQQLCMPPSMFGLLLCIFREGYYLENGVNICEININGGDSLIFKFSNIHPKIKNKN